MINNKSRTENSIRNVSFGLVVAALNTLVSFVTRTALAKILGIEVLGLNGLFTELIAMLSLIELGIGMAIIYSLYEPINQGDKKRISQLMGLYKTAYNYVALGTFLLGIILVPVIDKLVTDITYPISYVRLVFFLFVVRTTSSYLFAYKASLLNADQRQYVVSLITVLIKVITTVIIVLSLIVLHNFVLYLVLLIAQSLATNIVIAKYVDQHYQYINYNEKLDSSERQLIFSNIKNIFIKRLSGVITSSTDNVLISKMVSTIQVGYYSNYTMIFAVIRNLKQQISNAVTASIGNLVVSSSSDHCILVLKRLTFLYFSFSLVMTSGILGVSQTFITLWLGSSFVMKDVIVYTAVFNLFLEICCEPLWRFLEVSGLFEKDKNIGIFGSVVNLIVSIVLGRKIGILGIFIGTVCTQIIQLVLKTQLIYKEKFFRSPLDYYLIWGKSVLGFSLLIVAQRFLIKPFIIDNLIIDFFIKGIMSVIIAGLVAFLLFVRTDEWKYSWMLIRNLMSKRRRNQVNG